MENEIVSIYIPTKNRADYACRAIKSVLAQDYRPIEIVVVDDGSDAENYEKISKFVSVHPEVLLLRNKISQGAPSARNLAILQAKGSFITGLDDDDVFLQSRISTLVGEYRRRSGKCAFVTSLNIIQTAENRKCNKAKYRQSFKGNLRGNKVGNQVLTTKAKFVGAGLFDPRLKGSQDYDMWLRLLKKYGDGFCIQDALQVIHWEDVIDRITTSSERISGSLLVHAKYKKYKSPSQIRLKLLEIQLARGSFNLSSRRSIVLLDCWAIPTIFRYLVQRFRSSSKNLL